MRSDVVLNGQMGNETHHRCRQTQCTFWREGGCQACDDCGAAPFEIRKSCPRCFTCENIPEALRWGDRDDEKLMRAQQLMEMHSFCDTT